MKTPQRLRGSTSSMFPDSMQPPGKSWCSRTPSQSRSCSNDTLQAAADEQNHNRRVRESRLQASVDAMQVRTKTRVSPVQFSVLTPEHEVTHDKKTCLQQENSALQQVLQTLQDQRDQTRIQLDQFTAALSEPQEEHDEDRVRYQNCFHSGFPTRGESTGVLIHLYGPGFAPQVLKGPFFSSCEASSGQTQQIIDQQITDQQIIDQQSRSSEKKLLVGQSTEFWF